MAGGAVPAAGHRVTGAPAALLPGDVQDPVVAVVGRTVLVTAAGGGPEAAVRARLHRAQPAELTGEERLRGGRTVAGDVHDPQPGTAQGGHVERVVDDRQTARRGLRHRPGTDRRDEAGALA